MTKASSRMYRYSRELCPLLEKQVESILHIINTKCIDIPVTFGNKRIRLDGERKRIAITLDNLHHRKDGQRLGGEYFSSGESLPLMSIVQDVFTRNMALPEGWMCDVYLDSKYFEEDK
ncbi:MAG: hypothetical protein Q7R79_01550 [bacterium]|nr:hypothetical protein [bacterium]